ncbi:MAG: sulfate adenylyltransferase [Chitinispirillia bacterium]|nr:sulfate adenylyltransferase [Chitinispirillia bacterium]
MGRFNVPLDEETLQDLINIETGLFAPLAGFMGCADYRGVIDGMCLAGGVSPWTIPITLSVDEGVYHSVGKGDAVDLTFGGKRVGTICADDCFEVTDDDILKTFKTLDGRHPGVSKEKGRSAYRIGGRTAITDRSVLEGALSPDETKRDFERNGWKTVAGFQTRNPVHNAHEHLQRTALELCDAVFINPIMGWKKRGDFTEEAVTAAYDKMIAGFYPQGRIYFRGLKTQMRYAGPREAIFHAIIRRNLGCTHFIIGRDHAGVGGYYGHYEAHDLAREITAKFDLGIQTLLFSEPYYCKKCGFVVSNKTCAHEGSHKVEISGTIIRDCINNKKIPDPVLMRPEISAEIIKLDNPFIIL